MIASAPQPTPLPVPMGRSAAASSLEDSQTAPAIAFATLLERVPLAPVDAQIVPVLTAVHNAAGSGNGRDDATYSFAASSLFNTEATSGTTSGNLPPPSPLASAQPDDVALAATAEQRTAIGVGGLAPSSPTTGGTSAMASSKRALRETLNLPLRTPGGLAVSQYISRQPSGGQEVRQTSGLRSTLAAALKRAALASPSAGSAHVTVAAGAHGVIIASRLARADSDEIDRFAQASLKLAEELGCAVEILTINGRLYGTDLAGGA